MADQLGIHCYVSGRVQGVFFRASTKETAEQLELTGWVRNLPDGRVEIMAYGLKANLAKLHTWLKKGPRLAQVTELSYEEIPWQAYQGFQIL